jgi:probable HAF family extracellular repeat protein
MRNAYLIGATAALGCVISLGAQAQTATRYRMTILPDLPTEVPVSQPAALNDRGEVVGSSRNLEERLVAVLWSRDGAIRVLAENTSEAVAINNRSEAVGQQFTPPGTEPFGRTAFLWERRGPVDLGDLPGGPLQSEARDINNAREIIGEACDDSGCHAFRAGRDHALEVLPGLTGARAINDRGEIVGFSGISPVLWRDGEVITLPPLQASNPRGDAVEINNRGQIIGSSSNRPVLWQNGEVSELPRLPGYGSPFALAINESGTIVGGSVLTSGGAERAIAWEDGAMVDLENQTDRQPGQTDANQLPLTMALDVNERGQILVLARDTTSEINRPVAVVLTPEN